MKTKNQTQTDRIKAHLKSGKTLTSMEAFRLYRCTRLSAIVYRLIHLHGVKVKCTMQDHKNGRHGVYYVGKKPKA